jgi:hypothetical protein
MRKRTKEDRGTFDSLIPNKEKEIALEGEEGGRGGRGGGDSVRSV